MGASLVLDYGLDLWPFDGVANALRVWLVLCLRHTHGLALSTWSLLLFLAASRWFRDAYGFSGVRGCEGWDATVLMLAWICVFAICGCATTSVVWFLHALA